MCFTYHLLAIKVGKSHCPGEVLNSATDAILTQSAQGIAHERHVQFQHVGRLQLFEFAYTLFLLVDGLSVYFVLSAAVFTGRESIDKLYLLLLIFRYV